VECAARTEGVVVIYQDHSLAPTSDGECAPTCWVQLDGALACMEPEAVTESVLTPSVPDGITSLPVTGPEDVDLALPVIGLALFVVGVLMMRKGVRRGTR
jgi:LPXTG-motif cell wall-anchored protein